MKDPVFPVTAFRPNYPPAEKIPGRNSAKIKRKRQQTLEIPETVTMRQKCKAVELTTIVGLT